MNIFHKKIHKDLQEDMSLLGMGVQADHGKNSFLPKMTNECTDHVHDVLSIYEKIQRIGEKFILRYKTLSENTGSTHFHDGSLSCLGIVNEAADWAREMKKYLSDGPLTEKRMNNFCKHSYNLGIELMSVINKVNSL